MGFTTGGSFGVFRKVGTADNLFFSHNVSLPLNKCPLFFFRASKTDEFVKSPNTVMPDLIRHPEFIEITGFRLSPE
jgi:hypothetical protein